MSILYSEAQAALLECQQSAQSLLERYRHALDGLLADGEGRTLVSQRRDELNAQLEQLCSMIEEEGLLPRDGETELGDLQKLADRFQGWIDDESAAALFQRFAEAERQFQAELEQARAAGVASIEDIRISAGRMADRLTEQ